MKKGVLILVDELKAAGAENLAVNIAIKLKDSPQYAPVVCSTRWGGETEGKLKANNIEYFVLHRDHLHQIYKFSLLRDILKKYDIQVIHAHKIGTNFWGGIFGQINRTPVVLGHIHGQGKGWKNVIFEKVAWKLSDKLVTVSESERQRLIDKKKVPPAKIVTIYNGINIAKFSEKNSCDMRQQLGLSPNIPTIGISAELRVEKNHEVFLLAAREILKERKDPRFLIIGDGDERQKLETFARDLGIIDNCVFTGFIKNIPDMLAALDVGVLSSRLEALPLTLLEYMASAKPIVTTSVGGIPEVVQDGVNGFLFEPGDHLALAEKIKLLLDNKSLACGLGRNGRDIAIRKFSEETMMTKVVDLYSEMLAEKGH
jgi:glycosyltransferase involved in cell wall biosynthesis